MEEKPSILIVDDDESTRKTISLILSKKGYETDVAGDGQDAIGKIKKRFFNITLLDIRLPDVMGVELLITLKKESPDMAVIMLTGYASMETAIQALNNGSFAYLTKPLNLDIVLATIREALEKQQLIFENRRLLKEAQHELAERKRVEQEREKLIVDLKDALAKVKTLSGLLPICASCKKIRDDKGYWNQIEEYISNHSDAKFSHGLCPDCVKKLYPNLKKNDSMSTITLND